MSLLTFLDGKSLGLGLLKVAWWHLLSLSAVPRSCVQLLRNLLLSLFLSSVVDCYYPSWDRLVFLTISVLCSLVHQTLSLEFMSPISWHQLSSAQALLRCWPEVQLSFGRSAVYGVPWSIRKRHWSQLSRNSRIWWCSQIQQRTKIAKWKVL